MSGMNVSGLIMVQEAQRGGFEAHVYSTRVEAAIQLLRTEIRRTLRTQECQDLIGRIEQEVAELIASERADLESES